MARLPGTHEHKTKPSTACCRTRCEALTRLVIVRRTVLDISQEELAKRMHTTASAISRIESGQHATNARTLVRLAEALDARVVLGFEYGPSAKPRRQLVVL